MSKKRLFLDASYFYVLDTTPVNVNVIKTFPLTYVVTPTGGIDNKVEVSLQGAEKTEIAVASLDNALSEGKFAVDTSGRINFAVAKSIDTELEAENYITGLLVVYEMKNLSYSSTSPALYTMKTETSDGVVVSETVASSLSELDSKIAVLDNDLNLNTVGYYEHTIIRSIVAS